MDSSEITCPKCQQRIQLSAAIEAPIIERLRARHAAEAAEREAAFQAREAQIADVERALKQAHADVQRTIDEQLGVERERIAAEQQRRAREAVELEMRGLQEQLAEKSQRLTAAQSAEFQLLRDKRQLDEQRQAFELDKVRQIEAERQAIAAEQERKVREQVAVQIGDLQNELAEKGRRLAAADEAQLQLLREKRALDERSRAFEVEKATQIEAERELIREEARRSVSEQAAKELTVVSERLAAKDKQLAEAQQAELKLRAERAELEDRQQAFALELARNAEAVKDAVKKTKDEEFRLREAEHQKQMGDVLRQLEEARRKAEQGSQQTQGEVLELDLEAALRRCFGGDGITAVGKGVNGGDILHLVRGDLGEDCGTIAWESKRTKAWSDGWIQKLKDDRLAAKATMAVLVTKAMPKDAATFECREGVWVTPPELAVPLAAALRQTMIETAAVRRSVEGRQDKMEAVYAYLSGPEFKARVSTIVETFAAMRSDLEAEKRAMQKIWAKRDKQIERVMSNTAGLHGDLAGIIGRPLPAIELLDLPALPAESGTSEV
jgi:hypothetical protein